MSLQASGRPETHAATPDPASPKPGWFRPASSVWIWTLPFVLSVLVACGGDDGTTTEPPEPVASVVVTPDSTAVISGENAQFEATLLSSADDTLTGRDVTWSSSDTLVAQVDDSGLATGVEAGVATITATSDGASGSATLDVNEGPDPSVTEVSPSNGTVGTEVKVVGENFRAEASVVFDDTESDSVDVAADTLLFAIAPTGLDVDVTYDVTVRNRDDTEVTDSSAFTVIAPELEFVNSATKPSGKVGSTVILDGNAFADLQGPGEVLFSDGAGGTVAATISGEDDWTNTFIITTVPDGADTGDLVVTTATGTSNALTFTVTEEATFSPSTVDWTETTSLPVGISGHSALFIRTEDESGNILPFVHVTGGASNDSVPVADARFAPIQSDATLGEWSSTSDMTSGRAFHASVAATPFNSRVQGDGWIYVLGGIESKGGDPVTSVMRAPLNADGTVGSWEQTNPLPQAVHSLEAVLFRSTIYIVGGSSTGDDPVNSVYRAAVDTLGQVGTWESLEALPERRSYHELTVLGNCLHVIGGDSAQVAPNDPTVTDTRFDNIVRNRVDLRSGYLRQAPWTTDDDAPTKARAKQQGLIAGGGLLHNAGLYDGIGTFGSSENQFAQIASDCDVGSFSGANNSNSIKSKGGANLFNHASISFVDASGTAHVMIIAGDDVDFPGLKQAKVWVF